MSERLQPHPIREHVRDSAPPKIYNQTLMAKLISALSLAACLVAGLAYGLPDVSSIARAVDQHYNHLQTLQADFTEIYQGAGVERSETGTLWLKKPGKMRWEYRSPEEKLFLADGKATWLFAGLFDQLVNDFDHRLHFY